MILLEMTNSGFDCLTTLEPATTQSGHRLDSASVNDLDARVVGVNTPIAEIDNDLLRSAADVFEQDAGLLELLGENVAVVWVARKRACSNDQSAAMRDRDTRLHAEFVGLSCLAVG